MGFSSRAAGWACVRPCCGCWERRQAALAIGLSLQLFQLLYLTAVCSWAAGLLPTPEGAQQLLRQLTSRRGVALPICGLLVDTALVVAVLARLRALLALWLAWYACVIGAALAAAGLLMLRAARAPQPPPHVAAVLAFWAAVLLLIYCWWVVLSLLCDGYPRGTEPDKTAPSAQQAPPAGTPAAPRPADTPAAPPPAV